MWGILLFAIIGDDHAFYEKKNYNKVKKMVLRFKEYEFLKLWAFDTCLSMPSFFAMQ